MTPAFGIDQGVFLTCIVVVLFVGNYCGPQASLPLRTTVIQMILAAAMHPICSWRSSMDVRASALCHCDERTSVNMCVNNSGTQVFTSCSSIEPPPTIKQQLILESCHFFQMYSILW